MMKQTRTYTYEKVNIKDGKVKHTTSNALDDDVFMVFCVWRCSSKMGEDLVIPGGYGLI